MSRFFRFRRPRISFKERDLLVYYGEKEKIEIRYEKTIDIAYIYLGDVQFWKSGKMITEEEKFTIKSNIEALAPNGWNIAWASSPTSGW